MIKRILNRSKDYLFALPGFERMWINQLKGKVSCLLYHRVEAYGKHDFLDRGGSPVISEADFDREISYLKKLPTQFYTLADLNKGKFPDKDTIGIVICFDDCFKCNYDQGLCILERHGIHAVFFQCTGFINSSFLNWEHLLYWLYRNPATKSALLERLKNTVRQEEINAESIHYLRENIDSKLIEIQTLVIAREFGFAADIENLASQLYPDEKIIINAFNLGHEIASHGHGHYKRDTISDEIFELDLKQSYAVLYELLGQKPISYSYPFNSYSSKDHKRARQFFTTIANVEFGRINQPVNNSSDLIPRLTWPGVSSNQYRMKRWLLTGKF